MRILHTESSTGWGGQEIRILREAEGMRRRGHEVILAVVKGGGLVAKARQKGFTVYELPFKKSRALCTLYRLIKIIRHHQIDLVNTHSSLDAWLGGVAARIAGKKIIRTRHLSTQNRPGINSRLLYKALADIVVTTSSAVVPLICERSRLPSFRCQCIPTGVEPKELQVFPQEVYRFREALGLKKEDLLVGTTCIVRSWKGIKDFLRAADQLRSFGNLKWVIVGGGYLEEYQNLAKELDLKGIVHFMGHLDNPYPAMAAMDIFTLLSTAHEGISQATLQAAYLQRPLITTSTGGLTEVCLDGETGLVVPPFSPTKVVEAVKKLMNAPELREQMGVQGRRLVEEKFTFERTLDEMEKTYLVIGK